MGVAVGAAHVPFPKQTPLWQSVPEVHVKPPPHVVVQFPPQPLGSLGTQQVPSLQVAFWLQQSLEAEQPLWPSGRQQL